MKSANPENEYIPLDLRISVRRDTLRLISEMAQDMGISINEVFSFLAEDSVIDLELMGDLNNLDIPSKCSLDDLKKYSELLVNRGYKSDWENRKVEKF